MVDIEFAHIRSKILFLLILKGPVLFLRVLPLNATTSTLVHGALFSK